MCTELGTSSKYYDYTCPSGGHDHGGSEAGYESTEGGASESTGYETGVDEHGGSEAGYESTEGGATHTEGPSSSDADLNVYTSGDCSGPPSMRASAGTNPATSGLSRPARACYLCLSCSPRCRWIDATVRRCIGTA